MVVGTVSSFVFSVRAMARASGPICFARVVQRDDDGAMDRRKFVLVVLVLATLGGLGWWSYSSGTTSTGAAAVIDETPIPTLGSGAGAGGSTKPTEPAPSTTPPAPTTTVVKSPQAYSNALFGYWK